MQASDDIRVQLSALMDGELPREQALFLLRRMEQDAALREEWSRLHRVRDALNGEYAPATASFADRVMGAIAQEAAPQQAAATALRTRRMPWLQTVAGGAVAAGVAWVAVALVSPSPAPLAPASDPWAVAAEARPGSAATGAMLLPQQVFSQASQVSGGSPVSTSQSRLDLDRYLLRHGQAMQHSGMVHPVSPRFYVVQYADPRTAQP